MKCTFLNVKYTYHDVKRRFHIEKYSFPGAWVNYLIQEQNPIEAIWYVFTDMRMPPGERKRSNVLSGTLASTRD